MIDIDTIACSIGWIEIILVGIAMAVYFIVLLVWFILLVLKK